MSNHFIPLYDHLDWQERSESAYDVRGKRIPCSFDSVLQVLKECQVLLVHFLAQYILDRCNI